TAFDPSVRDATTAPAQIAMRELTKELDTAKITARDRLYQEIATLDEAGLMAKQPEWLDDVIEGREALPQEFVGTPVEKSLATRRSELDTPRADMLAEGLHVPKGGGTYQGKA